MTAKYSAVDLVKAGAAALGGQGGGGRPDMAQAGGPDGASAEAALNAIAERLAAAPAPMRFNPVGQRFQARSFSSMYAP